MPNDPYESFAERYDWMKQEDPARKEFFRQLFEKHKVYDLLDCACGTGIDLMMFLHEGPVSLVNSLCRFIPGLEFDRKRQDFRRKVRVSYKNNKNTNVIDLRDGVQVAVLIPIVGVQICL